MYFGIVASYQRHVNINFEALRMLRSTARDLGLNPVGIQPSTWYIVTAICCQGYVYTFALVFSPVARFYTSIQTLRNLNSKIERGATAGIVESARAAYSAQKLEVVNIDETTRKHINTFNAFHISTLSVTYPSRH